MNRVLKLVEHELVGLVATIAMLLATWQLLSRYLYPPASTHWIDEVVIYLIIWASCLSFSGLVAGNAHVRADLVLRLLPPRMQRVVEGFNTLAALTLCGLLVWFGGRIVFDAWDIGETSLSELQFPMWIYYLALPVGAALMALRYLARLAGLITGSVAGQDVLDGGGHL
ncbi:TRAP transporter small permease [Tistrella mobilis]|uniref:TRAP transporter small permease protein n=1 Tax=Tistrella mobilis (strain KA081020-065) TaxID=1110502 RepID=I3TSV2_TISMK|nr:TRAP transporter small permease [Tistrella mobilis]AFK55840.1 tripartite ATP-independent periplasmic transporter DctQ [Tistrella mobilis KA081020-065]